MSYAPEQTAITIEDHTPGPRAVRESAGSKVHLYYFQSPKNGRRFIFCGQLSFYLAILLEAELGVIGYGASEQTNVRGMSAQLRDGSRIEYDTCYLPDTVRPPVIRSLVDAGRKENKAPVPSLIVSNHYIRERQIEIENWIFLCAAMNRARLHNCEKEADVLRTLLERFSVASIDTLLSQSDIDKGCMLASIGRALQSGAVKCDTQDAPIARSSTLSLGGPLS